MYTQIVSTPPNYNDYDKKSRKFCKEKAQSAADVEQKFMCIHLGRKVYIFIPK